ncbi:GntR family transcriptional regulator [Mesorhizobium sp. SB112]|uniref:GntR family transcriptional regulator n=1 Tax=Mesorhizobium sp. SB112 TaxID=3151853 RepID=UPI003265CB9D
MNIQQGSDATDPVFAPVHQQVYQTLREHLITGRLSPGEAISLRSISEMLGVGMMPAREAIRRLAAENALEIQQNRRVCVPRLTLARFEELMQARVALEPLCASRALAHVDAARLERMIAYDDEINGSYDSGSADAYMLSNYRFHFELYRAGGSEVLVPLLESIWVQFGPFMRTVYDLVEKTDVIDKHRMAIDAIRRKDAEALKLAIHADILDGVYLLRQTL